MTELEAADIINRSDSLRCLNTKADLGHRGSYWRLTPWPNNYAGFFHRYLNVDELIMVAEKLQAEGTKTR